MFLLVFLLVFLVEGGLPGTGWAVFFTVFVVVFLVVFLDVFLNAEPKRVFRVYTRNAAPKVLTVPYMGRCILCFLNADETAEF